MTAVVSDNPNALVLLKVKNLNCDTHCFPIENNEKSQAYNLRLLQFIKDLSPDFVFLAGYMRILSSDFLSYFYDPRLKKNKVVNIHPSLLPLYPGKNSYERAFEAHEKISGCTVHYVDEGIDTGEIIFQKSFIRYPEDSLEEFKARGLKIENEIYPVVVEKILNDYEKLQKEIVGDK